MKLLKKTRVVALLLLLAMALAFAQPIQANAATNAKVHYIAINAETLSVLVECNGKFGMIDSGEDTDYPSGKDSRYPDRAKTAKGIGFEKQVINYLKSVGVNQNNFEFYIGTHPHSDHIGSADEVIREFKPKRVYIQEYKDSYITNASALWDNLYVYDNMVAAAKAVGAQLIQNITASNATFTLGDGMKVSIKNYGTDYKSGVADANYFSLGVLLEANGKSVFVGGDINNYDGDETRLLKELGHVDVLTLGHHGYHGSNTYKYVTGLTPKMLILPGTYNGVSSSAPFTNDKPLYDTLMEMGKKGVPLYATGWYAGQLGAIVVNFNSSLTTNIPSNSVKTVTTLYTNPIVTITYKNGIPTSVVGQSRWMQDGNRWWYCHADGSYTTNNWELINGKWYYFDAEGWMVTGWLKRNSVWYFLDSSGAMQTGWVKDGGVWYYMNADGAMQTGWIQDGGKWYYLNSSGAMQTGWIQLSGTWYYLYSDGSMAANTWVDGCYLNSSGAWVK